MIASARAWVQISPAPAMMSGQKRCSHENSTEVREKRRYREISPFFSTLKFFEILQMHFGVFQSVVGFEPTKRTDTIHFLFFTIPCLDSNPRMGTGILKPSALFTNYLQSHGCNGALFGFEPTKHIQPQKNQSYEINVFPYCLDSNHRKTNIALCGIVRTGLVKWSINAGIGNQSVLVMKFLQATEE